MKLVWDEGAWEDNLWWQGQDRKTHKRINTLIKDIARNSNDGTGKPEPLGGNLSGWWSRRINREHRLVYRVTGSGEAQALEVVSCRYHY